MVKHVIFDLDQTMVDSSIAQVYRDSRDWKQVYSKIPEMILYEGINELLHYLESENIDYSVLTSSPKTYCEKVLKHFRIKPVLIVSYHDVTYKKPHPEGIIRIIEKLSVQVKKEVIHIGDLEKDTVASHRAGVLSIGAYWGARDKQGLVSSKPTYIAKKPSDVIRIINDLQRKY